MTSRLGPVEIGAREIYDAVVATRGAVDRLADRHDVTRSDVSDHETRLRILERARWPLPSLAALISVASLVVATIGVNR